MSLKAPLQQHPQHLRVACTPRSNHDRDRQQGTDRRQAMNPTRQLSVLHLELFVRRLSTRRTNIGRCSLPARHAGSLSSLRETRRRAIPTGRTDANIQRIRNQSLYRWLKRTHLGCPSVIGSLVPCAPSLTLRPDYGFRP